MEMKLFYFRKWVIFCKKQRIRRRNTERKREKERDSVLIHYRTQTAIQMCLCVIRKACLNMILLEFCVCVFKYTFLVSKVK